VNFFLFRGVFGNPAYADGLLQFQRQQCLIRLKQRTERSKPFPCKCVGENRLDMLDGIHTALAVITSGFPPEGCQLLIVLSLNGLVLQILLESERSVTGVLEQICILLSRFGLLDNAVHIVNSLVDTCGSTKRRRAFEADSSGTTQEKCCRRGGNAGVRRLFGTTDRLDSQHFNEQAGNINLTRIRHDTDIFLAGENPNQFPDVLFDVFSFFIGHFPL